MQLTAGAVLEAENLWKTYDTSEQEFVAVRDVSLCIAPNELVLLMGPSGSGKTTLISMLAGLVHPSSGRVVLCGVELGRDEFELSMLRRRHIGFVFQNYHLFPALTALENVSEILGLHGVPRRDALERARAALAAVGLADRLHHRPDALSGGQRQRVAIARAFASNPDLLIGDEVTAALDSFSTEQVMHFMRDFADRRGAVLLVTHDHRLEQYADRIVEIEHGRVTSTRPGPRRPSPVPGLA